MDVRSAHGRTVTRYGDERRWSERERAFGPDAETFWRWQEQTADLLWDLALRSPAWPPQSLSEALSLMGDGLGWLAASKTAALRPSLLADLVRPVSAHLNKASGSLRLFVDAQLLIAAQTTSAKANALYGASALDLPRRGVVHLTGGMGGLSQQLAEAVVAQGGEVHYRQEVTRIAMEGGKPTAVETKRGLSIPADLVIGNLPPWNIAPLLGEAGPAKLRNLPPLPEDAWGAFTVYAGIDETVLPADSPLHTQVIQREPLGEGNSVFLSLSPDWDTGRAPAGQRALTLSTHTALAPWWRLQADDPDAYERRRDAYAASLMDAAERALPGIRAATTLLLPGTPVTFHRFTRRHQGWVGGFPQTNLFRTWAPKLGPNLWMVGDSIFPGQSTAAVALGGMRVARSILSELGAASDTSQRAIDSDEHQEPTLEAVP
jgi:phytoene dehydrogenase-like protein